MRRALILLGISTAALAGGNKALDAKKPKPIDAKANADKLEVWKDDLGQFYVVLSRATTTASTTSSTSCARSTAARAIACSWARRAR